MLEEILAFIHNYFVKEIHRGTFKISDGQLICDFLQTGQYFRIIGSIFNDGVYQYPAENLISEEFSGEIWAMAVPPAVIALVDEIAAWITENAAVINSPYQSESFGGYSYTKRSEYNTSTSGSGKAPAWAAIFRSKLNRWRKIS